MKFFEQSYEPGRLTGKSPRTVRNMKTTIRGFETWHKSEHGKKPKVTDLSRQVIHAYMHHFSEMGRQASTVNKIAANLSALWNWAYSEEIHSEPPKKITRLPEAKRTPTAWTLDEMRRLLESAAADDSLVCGVPSNLFWPTLIWTAFNSGARISAVMSINWADVNLDGAKLKILAENQKHGADQDVGLMDETVALLRELQPYSESTGTVFGCWMFDRGGSDWPTLNKGLRKILKRAELPASSRDLFHKFRRTFATHVHVEGGIGLAQEFLGHSTVALTKRYIDKSQLPETNQANYLKSPLARAA